MRELFISLIFPLNDIADYMEAQNMQPLKHLVQEHSLITRAVDVTNAFREEIVAGGPIRPRRY